MRLNIESVYIRNFRSFGDYDTNICLNKRGPTLINGVVDGDKSRSNGAGKSTIIEAIIWCLFGRLSDIPRPGDGVVNWDTDKNCIVKLSTADGYMIERTRKFDGHSDLFISKDGVAVDIGDSTTDNAQKSLYKLFNLDFNLFISSMFFGQCSGSFLELSEPKKKQVIENLFGLSKIKCYADVTKAKIDKSEKESESIKCDINNKRNLINTNCDRLEKLAIKMMEHDQRTNEKITSIQNTIKTLNDKSGEKINIDELKGFWNSINRANKKISEFDDGINTLKDKKSELDKMVLKLQSDKVNHINEIDHIQWKINDIEKKINSWNNKVGTICPACEQPIDESHVSLKIKSITDGHTDELKSLGSQINQLKNNCSVIESRIEQLRANGSKIIEAIGQYNSKKTILEDKIGESRSDKKTINEAVAHNNMISNIDDRIKEYKSEIKELQTSENPYGSQIGDIRLYNKKMEEEIKHLDEEYESINYIISHLKFIYKSYSDKRQIRSFITSGYIPILNNRLSYYFNELGITNSMSFDESLQIVSDKWGYKYHSGGEKKRVDLALMCALYDTFISMHGQITNILVLDEIDKELDVRGVDDYIRLIMDDLATRIDTILVISHKDDISHAFPSQIKVINRNENSYIEECT